MDQETPKNKIVQFRAHEILKITYRWLKDNFTMSENYGNVCIYIINVVFYLIHCMYLHV
jgi:hypothetical protein